MSQSFSAVLLAGGKSSRMGRDKALLEIDGVPLWRRQLSILQELQPREIFIAGPAREEWRDCIVIPDAHSEAGPLGGLVAALRRCSSKLLLILAIDLPKMTTDYLRRLLVLCTEDAGVVPRSASHFDPLAAVYPVSALSLAESCLASGNYSLQRFAERCVSQQLVRPYEILITDEPFLLNVNTPQDLIGTK